MTREQVAAAMLAILNNRVGVRGFQGAYEFLAEALGCDSPEEARQLDEFEYQGVRFTKRMRMACPGFQWLCWAVEERV